MEQKNLTDEDIVKALECCIEDNLCKACVLNTENGCIKKRNIATLDLIHRQKAEIERLTESNGNLRQNLARQIILREHDCEQAVKDTAKEIFDKIFFYRNRKDTTNFDNILLDMAKEYGVEVE